MHRVALRRIEKGEGIRASGRWHRRRLKPTLRVRGNRQQSARDGKGSFNGSANGIEMKLERADSKEIEGALRPNRPSAFGEIADLKLSETTARLMHRENLSRAEAANFLECLLNPAVTDAQIAAALTSLAVKGETVDERPIPQAARVRQEISDRDLVRDLTLESNARSIFGHRVGKLDLPFLIQHRGRQRCKRLGRGSDVIKRIGICLYAGFLIRHAVRADKDRSIVLDHDDRDARKVGKRRHRLADLSIVSRGEVLFCCRAQGLSENENAGRVQ